MIEREKKTKVHPLYTRLEAWVEDVAFLERFSISAIRFPRMSLSLSVFFFRSPPLLLLEAGMQNAAARTVK